MQTDASESIPSGPPGAEGPSGPSLRTLLNLAGVAVLLFVLAVIRDDFPSQRAILVEGADMLLELQALEHDSLEELVEAADQLPPEFWTSEAWPGKTWVFGWEDGAPLEDIEAWTPLSHHPHPGPWLAIGEYGFGDRDELEVWCDVSTGEWLANS